MLDSLDPRAGAMKISQFIKQEGEENSTVDLNIEPCDQKELSKSLHREISGFEGM